VALGILGRRIGLGRAVDLHLLAREQGPGYGRRAGGAPAVAAVAQRVIDRLARHLVAEADALLLDLGFALWAGAAEVTLALARFSWPLLALILTLTLLNIAARFIRWHAYLGELELRVPLRT
jgi:hypothetical protein